MKNKHNMDDFLSNSYLFTGNAAFVEELYAKYLKNPLDIDEKWRNYFDSLKAQDKRPDVDHANIRQSFVFEGKQIRQLTPRDFNHVVANIESKQVSVLQLINTYRYRGHQNAKVDPLKLYEPLPLPDLTPSFHNLNESDMDKVFNTGDIPGPAQATLKEIIQHLSETYCNHVGAEYMHISSTTQRRWLQERLESARAKPKLSAKEKRDLLSRLMAAEGLEKYLHTKYVGQKRFSIEGGESLIPLLDHLLIKAGTNNVSEAVIGMAHRGRLNVLINVLGKSPALLFQEFEGKFDPSTNQGSGDVKYHQGFSSDIATSNGSIHLALSFNPSHLEIISPVVEGSVRARQHRRNDKSGKKVLPIIIHGDAAFAGQGVVMETFNMSQARGYTTGGSIHIIVNNQIGFTTSNPLDARSTAYCTEVARMVQAPIFHVNGDDPEAVTFVTQLAFDYRNQFGRDVVIDLVCYRRHGHSEADEPSATQPQMYSKIRKHPTTVSLYSEKLINESIVTRAEIDQWLKDYRSALDKGEMVAPNVFFDTKKQMTNWKPYIGVTWKYPVNTQVSPETILSLSQQLSDIPEGFTMHPRVAKIMEERTAMANAEINMDWGFAETMAYACLLRDGFEVRISGQDCGRGTFFHRHAVLHDQKTGETHVPLRNIGPGFTVIDSLLSEEAVLGFEYGYSATDPTCLTIWEAQFGDFANGAQVVIDQFISSGFSKWGRLNGLTMFLPHGFDGQGPEHSSARLERYLQLCSEENIQVCIPTEPAQMFHMLRRQMLRPYRRPLVVMTPKSLLRHRESTSTINSLASGQFQLVIDDANMHKTANKARRVIFCCGKVYFDVHQECITRDMKDTAIVRIEQLYPFPSEQISEILAQYSQAEVFVWCQEEPENQGAWPFIRHRLTSMLPAGSTLRYAGRPESASPAVGYLTLHVAQQRELVEQALAMEN